MTRVNDCLKQGLSLANGIHIALQGEAEFQGLGQVTLGETVLRSGRRPMFVEIRNPGGITLCRYRLQKVKATAAGTTLTFSMDRKEGGMLDWMVHTVRTRYSTADWTEAPRPAEDTTLELDLRPVTRTLGGTAYTGFSYQYRYRSATIPIFRILDRGTWEPGGRAVGNEFWMRNCFTPPVVAITSVEQFHSTEWYLPDCANPSIFQFLPLQTELQGFTFTSGPQGTLVTWVTEVAHVRSLFEKPRGKDELVHWHEHTGDLALAFSTAPVEVLFAPGQQDAVGRANAYEAVKEQVHETLHAQLGMRRERVPPYGIIEEWGPADMDRYRVSGLPKLLAAGVRLIGLANHFQNNMNTWGVSNMCCTVDYQVAESVGREPLAALCRDAHAAGAEVEMWGNTSISTLTSIFSQRNGNADRIRFLPREGSIMEALAQTTTGFVRNPSNAIEADHYTPIFAVLNLRDPVVRDYWLKRWGEAHDQIGLDGIFLDSSFNLSSDKYHWVQRLEAGQSGGTADQTHLLGHYRPEQEPPQAILSQYRAHLDLMVAMQRLGYRYDNEDLGVFGLHRHGPGVVARLGCLSIWTDCIANLDVPALRQAGADPDDVFFRGLAYRMMWCLFWHPEHDALSFHFAQIRGPEDRPTEWHFQQLRLFEKLNPLMLERTILPGEKAVLYRGGESQVLWVFEDMNFTPDGDLYDMTTAQHLPAGPVRLARQHVYTLQPAGR